MVRYNIETLSFLVGSLKDIVQSFGENSKSIEFYKRQVQGLINIGQVSYDDAKLIEEVVGMRNTNAVKWESAKKKIEMFTTAMNQVSICGNEKTNIILVLEALEKQGLITDVIKEIVYRVYGIEKTQLDRLINGTPTKKFGEIPNVDEHYNNMTDSGKACIQSKKLAGLASVYPDVTIRVVNKDAVCSGDPHYFTVEINKLNSNLENYCNVLKNMAAGAEYEVGKLRAAGGNSCSGPSYYEVVTNEDALDIVKDIDWKILYKLAKTRGKR